MKKIVLLLVVILTLFPSAFAESVVKNVTFKPYAQNKADIANFLKQAQAAKLAKNPAAEAYALYRVGVIQYNMQNTLEALKYLKQAEAAAASKTINVAQNKLFFAAMTANIGHILLVTGQTDQARLYLKKAQAYDSKCPIVHDFERMMAQIQTTPNYFSAFEEVVTRWNDQTEEIKVYVTPDKPELVTQVKQAFSDWENAISQRLTFTYIDDPKKSDVVVKWAHAPIPDASGRLGGRCDIQTDDNNYFVHTDLLIGLYDNQRNPIGSYQLYRTMIHEIGHLLGLEHSPSPTDVMYEERGSKITSRDIDTFKVLYGTQPVLTNKSGLTVNEYRIQNGFE